MTVGFYLSVHHKIWVVFDAYDEALAGLKATVEIDDEHISPLVCAGLIGYRALQRAMVPEKGRLLLVGFGSSAHIVIQIAVHRGHEIWVVTRSENHIRQARHLGAAWADCDFS